jgi:hypothetical protein
MKTEITDENCPKNQFKKIYPKDSRLFLKPEIPFFFMIFLKPEIPDIWKSYWAGPFK